MAEPDDRQPGAEPFGGYLRVQLDGDPTPVPVAVEGREGDSLLVRRLEANEDPAWVAHDPSVREVILVTPVRHVGINLTAEPSTTTARVRCPAVLLGGRPHRCALGVMSRPARPAGGLSRT